MRTLSPHILTIAPTWNVEAGVTRGTELTPTLTDGVIAITLAETMLCPGLDPTQN